MSYIRKEYRLIVSNPNYTVSGSLTTDEEDVARVVMEALRASGLTCGVMIETFEVSNKTIMSNMEWSV